MLDPRITGVTDVLGFGGVAATPGLSGEMGLFHIPHDSIDWALMNPPYSRPFKGRRQATKGLEKLRALAKRRGWRMGHGQAGLATDFGNLCNIRMAPGGVLSHVLPLNAAHGTSWQNWRKELEKDFEDILVIAHASADRLESMSADTDMSEMLVIATKKPSRPRQWQPTEIRCVNLTHAPTTLAQGYALAREIANLDSERPQGQLSHGTHARVPQTSAGSSWTAVGQRNADLIAVCVHLLHGQAYDPDTLKTRELALPMSTLGELAESGPTHHLIGYPKGSKPLGAFEWIPLSELDVKPTQQAMWSADGMRQVRMLTEPTHGGTVVDPELARRMTDQRSQWFVNRNLALTSQSLAVAKTSILAHGGSTWNGLREITPAHAQCVALFFNSTLGMLAWWPYGQKAQKGPRARVQVKGIPSLPCPAFHIDTPSAKRARLIASHEFDRLSQLDLQPFAFAFQDANRHQIDCVVANMLGLSGVHDGEDELVAFDYPDPSIEPLLARYRRLFCHEPTVNGRQPSVLKALATWEDESGFS